MSGLAGRTADHRMFRVERPGAMTSISACGVRIQNSVIGQRDNFIDFVGRAETIKKYKWHAAFQRRDVRNEQSLALPGRLPHTTSRSPSGAPP